MAVIAYNAGDTIGDCLASLLNQDIPKHEFEVLVVDSGSTDGTLAIVRSFPDVRLVVEKERGRGLARNAAVESSGAEVIAFIDADCVASPDWLRRHLELLGEEQFDALGGAVLFPPGAGRIIQIQHHLYFGTLEGKMPLLTWDLATCNISFRRRALEEIGFFDEDVHQGEDTLACWALAKRGYKVGFHPGPKVTHLYRELALKDFLEMKRRDGITDHNLQLLFNGDAPYHLPTSTVIKFASSPVLLGARILRYASKIRHTMGFRGMPSAFGYLMMGSFYWLAGFLNAPKIETKRN